MSTSRQIAMLAPDGTPGMADAASAQEMVNQQYQPGVILRGPDGKRGVVAFKDLRDVLSQPGYKTEGDYQAAQQPVPDTPQSLPTHILDAISRFGNSAANAASQGVKSLYHDVLDDPRNATETQMNQSIGPIGIAGKRLFIDPQINQAHQAIEGAQSSNLQTRLQSGAHALAAAIPVLGPAAASLGDAIRPQLEQGNVAGAAGTLGGAAMLAGAGKVIGAAGGAVDDAITHRSTVPGQNYTPQHAAAFEGAIAKPNVPGIIPQQVTSDALSPIRQSTADMLAGTPEEQAIARAATDRGSAPLTRLGAVQNILQKSLTDLEDQHRPALAQHGATPVDMRDIQAGLRRQITPGMSSADIAGINDLISRSGEIKTISNLNSFRQLMNDEAAPSYRQTPTRAGQTAPSQQVATDTANAVRGKYFDEMQKASGTDYGPLKQKESKVIIAKDALERLATPEARAEATFRAPSTLKEKIGEVANIIKEPRTTVTQTILRESPGTRISNLLRQSLTNLPEANPSTKSVSGEPVSNGPFLPTPAQTGIVQAPISRFLRPMRLSDGK